MDKIRIKDPNSSNWYTLPRIHYTVGGEELSNTKTMQSGKERLIYTGYRIILTGNIEELPDAMLSSLNNLIRTGVFLKVEFTDTDQQTKQGMFKITPFKPKVFKWRNSNGSKIPVWTNMEFYARAQEVLNVSSNS